MENDKKVHIYNRLFFKLYFNYAIMLLVTAILIGLIYMNLYQNFTIKNNTDDMYSQAKVISTHLTQFIENDKTADALEYLLNLDEIYNMDIYTISNPYAKNPMDTSMESGDSFEAFVKAKDTTVDVIKSAFNDKPDWQKMDDKLTGVPTITVAVPIYGFNTDVVGCILLKTQVKEVNDIVTRSLRLIVNSCILSLAISFIIIILFAKRLSLPITKMRATALELAAGNYNIKTEINRNDEIGDLAKTVDILSEKLLENDIQRKNLDQMRFDFFANVSHELRTPITVIRAYTETLVDGVVKEEEKVNGYYNRMLSECKTMERLVGDLLLLSKMQNPDFAIEKEPVNLLQVFDDIIRSASAIAEKKNITIEVKNNDPIYIMLGDYDRLRQMFMIIFDNAIKFSEVNKTVHINLSKADKIIVSIRDDGIGIEPSDIPNIFEKFYKSNLRQNASGTGLGLAIAKQIALKHEGIIEVISTPGVGTEFIFSFPIYNIESQEVPI